MKSFIKILSTTLIFNFINANDVQPALTEEQQNELMSQVMQLVWEQVVIAKEATSAAVPRIREELLENLCSSAPSSYFVTHADLSDSLTQAENTSASVFVSSDNQATWVQNNNVAPLNSEGFETTWGATTQISNTGNVNWYLQGSLESSSLGLDFGQITVSQSPNNADNSFPPASNLYANLVDDSSDDTSSDYDIVNLKATYSEDRLFASLGLEGGCCNEGGFFGPWNLYVIAILNPEAETPVGYAYGYGNGGFGQLYPAIYKVNGDLTSGQVDGFEVLSDNFQYSTNGNNFQASSLLSIITNDSDWGVWPNSLEGIALVGVTVSAGLSGLDISTEILDTTNPGVLIMSSQSQSGNNAPILSDPTYENGRLSVVYTDTDNNLATDHSVLIEGDMMFTMIPETHTYSEGVTFYLDVETSGMVEFSFSDGADYTSLEFDLGGGSACQILGDANGDTELNVLDVVLTVNLILNGMGYEACSDVNADNELNVLDVVALINLILG